MIKQKIDKLVLGSYKNNNLDKKKVNKVASLLSSVDLKKYINGLKTQENKRNLIVYSPANDSDYRKFERLFPNKKIVFKKDPSLMLGVKIVDNDIIYEFTLKNSLDKIINYIEQNYD